MELERIVRLLPMVLMLGLVAPQKARAKARSADGDDGEPGGPDRPPSRQGRRMARRVPPAVRVERSPCGRNVFQVEDGHVLLNGRVIHDGQTFLLGHPAWRRDGDAIAWLERWRGAVRLVVLPAIAEGAAPLAWTVPSALGQDGVHWSGGSRVTIGPNELEPRAIASWD